MAPHPWENWLRDRSNILLLVCATSWLQHKTRFYYLLGPFFTVAHDLITPFFDYTHITCVTKWVIPTKSFWKGNRLSVIKRHKRLAYKSTLAVHWIVSVGFGKSSHYKKNCGCGRIFFLELALFRRNWESFFSNSLKCESVCNAWIGEFYCSPKRKHWG